MSTGFDFNKFQEHLEPKLMREAEKRKKLERARQEFNDRSVHIYKTLEQYPLIGKGYFHLARFHFPVFGEMTRPWRDCTRAMSHKVFCFIFDNKENNLNMDWSRAERIEFDIWTKDSYSKAQKWYELARRKGLCVSHFFVIR